MHSRFTLFTRGVSSESNCCGFEWKGNQKEESFDG